MVDLALTQLAGDDDAPRVLVVGPSLGTGVADLWQPCAQLLADGGWQVVGWDLPGHGVSAPAAAPFTVADLASAVRDSAARVAAGRPAAYAGVSLGGAVGFDLAADPGPFAAVVTLASARVIGTPEGWRERAALVRKAGTSALVAGSAERWFAPGFLERSPSTGGALLMALREVDDETYALACEALAAYDVRGTAAVCPLLVAGGADDVVVEPHLVEVVLDGVAHLPPIEDPAATAALVRSFLEETPVHDPYDAGMRVRREVLGDAHVERAEAAKTPFTEDFQALITRYAWGSVWTRPGLDRRSRSIAVLTALIALGHWEELAMHVRAARTNGLTDDEIAEVILQAGVYCGVPAANHAFAVAQQVLGELS